MGYLKILGATAAATLALGAVGVSSALATYDQQLTGQFALLAGGQVTQNVITTVSGTAKCEIATFSGNGVGAMQEPTAGTTTYAEVTVHPRYEKCKHAGLAATINTEGCNYILTTATTTETAVTGFDAHAAFHIECEAGKKIVINAGSGGCVTEIGEQTPGGVVDLKNEASGEVLWQWTIEGIKYHQVGTKCTGGTLEPSTGTMTGTVIIGGINPNTAGDVAISVT